MIKCFSSVSHNLNVIYPFSSYGLQLPVNSRGLMVRSSSPSPIRICQSYVLLDAIRKITGAVPAYMRPRKFSTITVLSYVRLNTTSLRKLQQYGLGGRRGEKTRCCTLGFRVRFWLISMTYKHHSLDFPNSTGDSTGASVSQQKKNYDDLVKRKPNTIISLAHDVHGTGYEILAPP